MATTDPSGLMRLGACYLCLGATPVQSVKLALLAQANIGGGCVAPTAPVAIDSTDLAETSFSANWNASAGATGYQLDVATDAGFVSMVAGFSNLDVGNVLTKSVTGLTGSTQYWYRVRAYNAPACVSGNSNVITITTSAPACNTTRYTFSGVTQTNLHCGDAAPELYIASRFTNIAANYTACKVTARLSKVGNGPAFVMAAIYTNAGGSLPGTLIGSSAAIPGASLGVAEGDATFLISAALTSGTIYHLVLWASGIDASNYFIAYSRTGSFLSSISPNGLAWTQSGDNKFKFTLFSV